MAENTKHKRVHLPILQGLLPIDPKQIPAEIVAGLTLAALAIPEVMGYTKIAGTPVVTGLYTMLVPTTLFALFGSSRHLVVGADSATAAILAAALVGLAATGSDEYLALAQLLALMAAGLLILARLVRLGFMADFLSRTVLVGFLTGVGIQVALGQLDGMLGLPGEGHGVLGKLWSTLQRLNQVNGYAIAVASLVLIVILGCRKLSHKIPGALIAVVGAVALSWALNFAAYMPVLGEVPSGLPHFGIPKVQWSLELLYRLLPTAFAMFVVILAQSAATSRAYASRYNEPFSENIDLVGLAVANVGAALSGTFVVNGSPTKTQMVDSAGGRSQFSLLVTALIVLMVLLFLTAPLAYMPEATLAAVVFMIGIELTDFKTLKRIYVERRDEFWVALITLVTVVLVGVKQGIILAMVLSIIDHLRRGYHPKNVLLAATEGGKLHPVVLSSGAQARPGLLIYRFTHSMYYANSRQLSEEVTELVAKAIPGLCWFCIDCSAIDDVDYSAAETIRSLAATLKAEGVRMVFVNVMPDLEAQSRYKIKQLLGEGAIFAQLDDLLGAYERDVQAAR
ncbi:sulfate transporter [Pseudomonas knackmussii B13]|uniref:Sulfate transporter n=1 Tax=Pseudomonas knackmussii (strain DSM 6978 / CCUG 54928 / LMG 23759 / B13) TaxID=1301098 RepID=A0A024HPJ8_PSEKB|nr:SulP family inorganic anion transporter [Pseudomonas knackmussii]CDF86791.1 sulfate transporter [Pseudomonas knackmussii B13]